MNHLTLPKSSRKSVITSLLVIIAVGIFQLSTIRGGHDWGDDFGMYVGHARNIVEGRPYSDTGYVFNPEKIIGPKTYPPALPLLLAPVYRVFGIDFRAMKAMLVMVFLLSLSMILLAFRYDLPWPYMPALLALVGFNPVFWMFKDIIATDMIFLAPLYFSFYFIHRAFRAESRIKIRDIVIIAGAIYLAYGTRAIGIVLIPCLIVWIMMISVKPIRAAAVIIVITAALIFIQARASHAFTDYVGHFGFNSIERTTDMTLQLIGYFSSYWSNGYSNGAKLAFFFTLSALAAIGLAGRIRKITMFELFVPSYVIPLVVLPITLEQRYCMPLIPIFIFYVLLGIRSLTRLTGNQAVEKFVLATVLAVALLGYAGVYSRQDFGPIKNGVTAPEAVELFDYVRKEIGEKEVIIFRKPRALSLFTGRPAAVWHSPINDDELWEFFDGVNAAYLIAGPPWVEPGDQSYIQDFISRYKDRFSETYSNDSFRVYRINRAGAD